MEFLRITESLCHLRRDFCLYFQNIQATIANQSYELQVWHYRPFLWDSSDPHVRLQQRMSCCILCGLRDTFFLCVCLLPQLYVQSGCSLLLLALMNYRARVGPVTQAVG